MRVKNNRRYQKWTAIVTLLTIITFIGIAIYSRVVN